MDLEKLSLEDLKQKVSERKAWLTKLIGFAEEFVPKHGKRVNNKPQSSLDLEYVLEDFGDFSFESSGVTSIFGNMRLRIWHKSQGKSQLLLDMNYSPDKKEILVDFSFDHAIWLGSLIQAVEHKDEILASIQLKKSLEESVGIQKNAIDAAQAEEKEKWLKEAEKLKL